MTHTPRGVGSCLMNKVLVLILALVCSSAFALTKFEALSPTPPMGWNSWNAFHCDVSEQRIRDMADAIVASGMKDAGYEYVVIDDCWQIARESDGTIIADPERFPSGMKALADYVHNKGLKFGLYSDAGTKTCAGRPGSKGFEKKDADTYAEWGVDYVKYDWCNTANQTPESSYKKMSKALQATGRPIILAICEWGGSQPWKWARNVGHLARTTSDIAKCFDCIVDRGTFQDLGIMQILDKNIWLRGYAGPGFWNDPDMLQVGNGMTAGQDRAHFALWAMLAAPLIAGNDVTNMSEQTKAILTNKAVIAVDQDALGVQGYQFYNENGIQVWFKPLEKGDWAMVILNRNETTQEFTFDFAVNEQADGISKLNANFATDTYSLNNLWTGLSEGNTANPLAVTLPAQDAAIYRLSK